VVDDFEAILETVTFFSRVGAPKGAGIGVMSASGGAAVMAADRASDVGVSLPPLADETASRLSSLIPNFGSTANPCDITAASVHDKKLYGEAIKTFADDPSFAAVRRAHDDCACSVHGRSCDLSERACEHVQQARLHRLAERVVPGAGE
jgi:acyl-CoA synthetase (NDP forming)